MARATMGLLLCLLLVGCQRGAEGPQELPTVAAGDATPTIAVFGTYEQLPGAESTLPPVEGEVAPSATPEPAAAVEPPTPAPPPSRFNNLRFATSGDAEPQGTFPVGTEQVCAIWEYQEMTATDIVRRLWVKNEQPYVERKESWDIATYGAAGTVRDICLYDRIDSYIDGEVDGIDPGAWRVDLYLNDELQLSQSFTVGAP